MKRKRTALFARCEKRFQLPPVPKIEATSAFKEYAASPKRVGESPDAIPPFPSLWIEGKKRGADVGMLVDLWRVNREEPSVRIARSITHFGKMLQSGGFDPRNYVDLSTAFRFICTDHYESLKRRDPEYFDWLELTRMPLAQEFIEKYRTPFDAEGIVSVSFFMRVRGYDIARYAEMILILDADGRLNPRGIPPCVNRDDCSDSQSEAQDMTALSAGLLAFTLSLINCSNVELSDEEFSGLKRERKDTKKKIIFKTLVIKDLVKRKKGGARPLPDEKQNRLHICRGHFADYTKGKGLFGRINGRFWFPAHVRGTTKHGMVIKDYKTKGASPKEVGTHDRDADHSEGELGTEEADEQAKDSRLPGQARTARVLRDREESRVRE